MDSSSRRQESESEDETTYENVSISIENENKVEERSTEDERERDTDETSRVSTQSHRDAQFYRKIFETGSQHDLDARKEHTVLNLSSILGKRLSRKSRKVDDVSRLDAVAETGTKVHKAFRKKFSSLGKKLRVVLGVWTTPTRIVEDDKANTTKAFETDVKNENYVVLHPYIALKKRMEDMSKSEGREEYRITYKPFYSLPNLITTDIPIFATNYDNERKKQARKKNFMFGRGPKDRYDNDNIEQFTIDPSTKPRSNQWANKSEANIAFFAVVFSISNLFKFPDACYHNGGIIFFLLYSFIMLILIQPIIYFEMLVGQFSVDCEWGFGRVHRLAKGFPYAVAFVNVVFVTLNNALVGYTGLYALHFLRSNEPGSCNHDWEIQGPRCIPYKEIHNYKELMIQKQVWVEKRVLDYADTGENRHRDEHEKEVFYDAPVYLSTELFFRYYIMNWRVGTEPLVLFHWRFILMCMLVVIIILPASMQKYIASTITKAWIYIACALPIVLGWIWVYQLTARKAIFMRNYFLIFKWNDLGKISLWSDAFQMAFSTVGVGYGVLMKISSRNHFSYKRIRQTSWNVTIFAIVFALLSCLVVYTELSILGDIAGATDSNHIFDENHGISFICISGALIESAPSSQFIAAFFVGISIFNIWALVIAIQTSVSYLKSGFEKLSITQNQNIPKWASVGVTLLIQFGLISLHSAYAIDVSDSSFDLFGGYAASLIILVAEMGIAFVLLGFREFMTDVEIMSDMPVPYSFQMQIRFFVPGLLIFAFIFVFVGRFFSPPRYVKGQAVSFGTYYVAFCLNLMPLIILIACAFVELKRFLKVFIAKKEVSEYKKMDAFTAFGSFWKARPRWSDRRESIFVSLESDLSSMRSRLSIGEVGILGKSFHSRQTHHAHCDLKDNMRILYKKYRSSLLWNRFWNQLLARTKFKSIPQTIHYLVREERAAKNSAKVDVLRHLIRNCSTVALGTSAVMDLKGKVIPAQEEILLNRLLKTYKKNFYSAAGGGDSYDEESDYESASEDVLEEQHAKYFETLLTSKEDQPPSSQTSEASSFPDKAAEAYRRVVGKKEKTPEEVFLEAITSIKNDLEFPCEKEYARLKELRQERLRKETDASHLKDLPPEEQFKAIKVVKQNEAPVLVFLHIIVLEGRNHFVLTRLPVPQPKIVYLSHSQAQDLPGDDLNNKIVELGIRTLNNGLYTADLHELSTKPKTFLLDNLNAEIYSFLDSILTCIVVFDGEKGGGRMFGDRFRYLMPPTRRRTREEDIPYVHEPTYNMEGVTCQFLKWRKEQDENIERMLNEPEDIVYHLPGDDTSYPSNGSSVDQLTLFPGSSSSSGSTGSSSRSSGFKGTEEFVKNNDEQEFQSLNRPFLRERLNIFRDRVREKRHLIPGSSDSSIFGQDFAIQDLRRRNFGYPRMLNANSNPAGQTSDLSVKVKLGSFYGTQKLLTAKIVNMFKTYSRVDRALPRWSRGGAHVQRQGEYVDEDGNRTADPAFVSRGDNNIENNSNQFSYSTEDKTLIIERVRKSLPAVQEIQLAKKQKSTRKKAMRH